MSRRARCAQCLRPQHTCLCALAQPVEHAVQLLVLQHPEEELQAKGTGRLLHLCLPASRLAVGEAFGEQALHALLHGPWQPGDAPRQPVLLYPDTPHGGQLGLAQAAAWPEPVPRPEGLRLVVLDATWRKSRKMLYLNPGLQALPRLELQGDLPASRYGTLRKAHAPNQLSTLEATACALERLDAQGPSLQPLRGALAGFLALHAAHRPQASPVTSR
ncbi:tRNA-uridine aminocarboxypropyltransferase [Delftia sp. PS-11]|uniref:tRNA-uridine aminocarboxypropyltransferase n=1 Tax=Delftia sp. PS-11 TaxID=2767222 RepID=UPI0024589181|nr:tRNA-uridine aminocarboxypropyltransferase [Delftia sp. PS-11]KAJ8744993.1 DTW domain-containing protein [Delftia sp. PS-11]